MYIRAQYKGLDVPELILADKTSIDVVLVNMLLSPNLNTII
jgi:hypothetical protein